MNIRKRTGEVVPFQEEKILNAMKKAFSGQGQEIDDRALDEMLSVVLKRLPENGGLTVERVQDEVERVLMECGHTMRWQKHISCTVKSAPPCAASAQTSPARWGMMPSRTSYDRSRRISRKRVIPSAPCS